MRRNSLGACYGINVSRHELPTRLYELVPIHDVRVLMNKVILPRIRVRAQM